MKLKKLSDGLLNDFTASSPKEIDTLLKQIESNKTPVDYFAFYNSISTVYSSKIEGENIDYDSYFKHRFLHVAYQADYTKKADDLFRAYEYILQHELTLANTKKAHAILSDNLLPQSQQGKIRNNPMFVINNKSRIEYVAAEAHLVEPELDMLFSDIEMLIAQPLNVYEVYYYAAYIHLVFVKIHPFQDGNGRTARLLEKWFLINKMGPQATAIQLEKNYFNCLQDYYKNIRLLGLEYPELDYHKALPFLLMTIQSISGKPENSIY